MVAVGVEVTAHDQRALDRLGEFATPIQLGCPPSDIHREWWEWVHGFDRHWRAGKFKSGLRHRELFLAGCACLRLRQRFIAQDRGARRSGLSIDHSMWERRCGLGAGFSRRSRCGRAVTDQPSLTLSRLGDWYRDGD